MRIEGVDKNTIIKLRNSSISTQMKSLESCDWVVLEEEENVLNAHQDSQLMRNQK